VGDEFPSDITLYGAIHGALCSAFDFETGASAELRKREDDQLRNTTYKNTLLNDSFLLLSMLRDIVTYNGVHNPDPFN
jgi:hypothetical protein